VIIHCVDFGKGIDMISKKLASEWIKFNKDIEAKRAIVELQKFRELEQKDIKETEKKMGCDRRREQEKDRRRQKKKS